MKMLIAGSNGMIGSAVTRHLLQKGHQVIRLVRKEPENGEVFWSPDAGKIDKAGLEGFDAVIHLATMPWPMRWTATAKQELRANRLATNRLLAESDGRSISVPIAWFPRLLHASEQERNNWRLIGKGQGIHWEDIAEDISIEELLAGRPSGESQESFKRWLAKRSQKAS